MQMGQQVRVAMRFALPETTPAGRYRLHASVEFTTGETQEDAFDIDVLPRRSSAQTTAKIALFDPKGETRQVLDSMPLSYAAVDAGSALDAYDVLIVGKEALTVNGPAPDIRRVREGLKVILFEQTPDVLEKRFGFRTAEYGLRKVFPHIPDHPLLRGLGAEHLSDWRGQSTILPPRLDYERSAKFNTAPTVDWCGIPVTRAWRCGNRGNVASILIEKPACGDFLAIVDGGFSLQYSPLLEYREGQGMVLFCQLDVTGRTEPDPAAEILTANLIAYVQTWKPQPQRRAYYAGASAGREHLESAGFRIRSYKRDAIDPDSVLILGPNSRSLATHKRAIAEFAEAEGRILALGLTQEDVDALLPIPISTAQTEHISAYFDPPMTSSPLAGIGPADVHNRAPRTLQLVSGGAEIVGNGVLAVVPEGRIVFCQIAPWDFRYHDNFGLKRTFRRTSCLVTRLLANLGVQGRTPLLARFSRPPQAGEPGRWLNGFYLDEPEEWDDPYRFFRW